MSVTLRALRDIGVTVAIAAIAWTPLAAQAAGGGRDPAYAAARASGAVGEKMDGYLGVTGEADAATRKMVEDINIKRRALYSEKAKANNATVEEYAFTSGCLAISRTAPGERYVGPDGSWQIRSAAAPSRDSRCP